MPAESEHDETDGGYKRGQSNSLSSRSSSSVRKECVLPEQLIKIVTGIRRCGKLTLLEMYQNWLLEHGTKKEKIRQRCEIHTQKDPDA